MSILDGLFGHRSEKPRGERAKPDAPMQKVLDVLQQDLGVRPFWTLSPQEARREPTPADAVKKILRDRGVDANATLGVATRNFTISGPGGEIPARLYGPETKDGDQDELLPVVVYWHGGGWVFADLDVYDASPRGTAKAANCIVVSCRYRQAPEHKFPAAHEDALACYRWVIENAQDFGGDPQRVAVMGESAGGNLACATAMAARDQGLQKPLHMALIYPVAGADMTRPSYQEHAEALPLGKPGMEWFVRHVFESKEQANDPRIDLVNADLHELPSATVVNAEIDPLRSEGELLADRLEAAGVPVRHKTWNGSTHEFFGMAAVLPDAAAAQTFVAHELKRAFKTAVLPI
jgi:acetyl esterase/lipase